jgi:mono/diheme cytochrome c family protein
MKKIFPVVAIILLAAALDALAAADVPDNVKTLFGQRCAGCHKGKFPPKGLNLEPANVAAILDAPSREVPELKIVDTKAPEASYLLKKVRRESGIAGKPMPPGKALAADQLQVLEAWLNGLK